MRPTTASRRQQVIELVASGLPPAAAAERAGVSLRAVRRYLADPSTRQALAAIRDERLRSLAGRALTEAGPALAILRAIAEDASSPPAARVSAAGRLLDTALRLAEGVDLAERVETLEAIVKERQ